MNFHVVLYRCIQKSFPKDGGWIPLSLRGERTIWGNLAAFADVVVKVPEGSPNAIVKLKGKPSTLKRIFQLFPDLTKTFTRTKK